MYVLPTPLSIHLLEHRPARVGLRGLIGLDHLLHQVLPIIIVAVTDVKLDDSHEPHLREIEICIQAQSLLEGVDAGAMVRFELAFLDVISLKRLLQLRHCRTLVMHLL